MKVLIFVSQFFRLGGAERLAFALAEDLNHRGIRADLLSMYSEELPGMAEAKATAMNAGVRAVHFLGMPINPPAYSLFPAAAKLRRLLVEQGYDAVETSTGSPTVLASWAVRGTRTRHIAGLHQVYRKGRETSWQQRFLRISVCINRRIRYYAISDYAARCWVEYSGTPSAFVRRVYNGIPEEFFLAKPDREAVCRELGLAPETRIVLYVGRLASYKGIDSLLYSIGQVLKEENLALVYAGQPDPAVEGSVRILGEMERFVAENGLGHRVKFAGLRHDVPRLMASSDVLAHPTRMEGFGLTLVEALAAGLPVVSTDVEAIPEVLSGTHSVLVKPDDRDGLREGVLKVLRRTREEAALAAEKGRKRAREFSMGTRTDAMIRLMQDVLEGRI